MQNRWPRLVVVAAVLLSAPVAAAEDWQIARTAGTVWILKAGEEPRIAAAGTSLPNAATLATSPDGGAVLTRGEESVEIGAESVLAVVQRGARSTILMAAGAVVLEVERRNSRSFTVETPFLTAAPTATHFAVRVGNGIAAVDVGRGTVEVTALGSGERAELTAGVGARVVGEDPVLRLVGGQPEIVQGRPREARVPTFGSLMVASLLLDFLPAGAPR
jgi:hypothetical protein